MDYSMEVDDQDGVPLNEHSEVKSQLVTDNMKHSLHRGAKSHHKS